MRAVRMGTTSDTEWFPMVTECPGARRQNFTLPDGAPSQIASYVKWGRFRMEVKGMQGAVLS